MNEGVRESIILQIIEIFSKILGDADLTQSGPISSLLELQKRYDDLRDEEYRLESDPSQAAELARVKAEREGVQTEIDTILKDNDELFQAFDSIDEAQDLLNELEGTDPKFVRSSKIQERIEEYVKQLAALDGKTRTSDEITKLQEEIDKDKAELAALIAQRDAKEGNDFPEWGPLSEEEIDDAIQQGFIEYTPGDQADFDFFLRNHGYDPEKLKEEYDKAHQDKDVEENEYPAWGPLSEEEIDDAIQQGYIEYTPGDQADFDFFLRNHGYDPEKLKEEYDKAHQDKDVEENEYPAWGPLSEEEIDDAIQQGYIEYTPGDQADFDFFLRNHGYDPKKLKEEYDKAHQDKDVEENEYPAWGPLSEEEIDDAIQQGYIEYTPGDQADFDFFLRNHGYDPKKLKEEYDKAHQDKKGKDNSDLDKRIKELQDRIKEKEKRLKELKDREGEKEEDAETRNQRRVLQNKIRTLEAIDRQREPFDKDNKPIDRGPVEIDKDQLRKDIMRRTDDMLDKYYGNSTKAKVYKENWKELKKHIVEQEFEYVDASGNVKKGTFKTVEEYEDMQAKMEMMQLKDYKEKLERVSKAEAGDSSMYPATEEGKKQYEEDKFYVDTFNASYNRVNNTKANLITLGKYGEKVPYSKMQKGQPIRNVLRGGANVLKFLRNYTTAPINKFMGKYIVSPIYGVIRNPEKTVAGLYSNKASHRYVARREYFQSQGDGYLKSRLKAVFKYKDGNKAVLSAGKREIEENAMQIAIDNAKKEQAQRDAEWKQKSYDEKIALLEKDLADTKDITKQAEIRKKIGDLNQAKELVSKQKEQASQMRVTTEKQNDAVDYKTHDVANKENVTRTVTGVKILAKAGVARFVGPKISTWLDQHKTINKKHIEYYDKPTQSRQWVEPTYKDVPTTSRSGGFDGSIHDMMSQNAGKDVTGYYSVHGGEVAGQSYKLTGNENITAIFQGKDFKSGTGLSDAAGLTNPVFTDKRFAEKFLDANGVLKQDVDVNEVIDALGANTDMTTLDQLYFSVGDKCWVRASDLMDPVKIVEGTKRVVDQPGHWQITNTMVRTAKEVVTKVPNPRVVKILKHLGKADKIAAGALLGDDLYENLRKTDSDRESIKPNPRNYEDNGMYTGTHEDVKESRKAAKEEYDRKKKEKKNGRGGKDDEDDGSR